MKPGGGMASTAQTTAVAFCGKYDRRDDEEFARLPRGWVTIASVRAARTDDLHESQKHVRIDQLWLKL